MDLALILYIYLCCVALLGVGLFITNWVRLRKATYVYAYMTLLLVSIVYDSALMSVARYLHNIGDFDRGTAFLNTGLWTSRLFPMALVLTIFVTHMYYRFFIERGQLDDSN